MPPTDRPTARGFTSGELVAGVEDARRRTLEIVADLSDEQLRVPYLTILNPFVWEIGHVAWFQEKWVLRHQGGHEPLHADADALYDSSAVRHDTRWSLPLPSREQAVDYLREVRDRVAARLGAGGPAAAVDPAEAYFNLLSIHHEDMHGEAFLYTRHTLGYPAPALSGSAAAGAGAGAGTLAGPLPGDVEVPGGEFPLGTSRDAPFRFDNEQEQHSVAIAPFSIARAPVTQSEVAAFVDDGGYRRQELWTPAAWQWRCGAEAEQPAYWRRGPDGAWQRRHYDRWRPLEPHRPAIHVNWFEAEAYCRWAGRRLPTEGEWEAAAAGEPAGDGTLAARKRIYPWGDEPPDPRRANLDARVLDTVDVAAHPEGDTAFGCRQMLGNVWEWTASDFLPYPGFAPGPYKEYSEPWFATHKVLRGGAWPSRSRLVRNAYRNFYPPHRRDVFAGFRTCADDR